MKPLWVLLQPLPQRLEIRAERFGEDLRIADILMSDGLKKHPVPLEEAGVLHLGGEVRWVKSFLPQTSGLLGVFPAKGVHLLDGRVASCAFRAFYVLLEAFLGGLHGLLIGAVLLWELPDGSCTFSSKKMGDVPEEEFFRIICGLIEAAVIPVFLTELVEAGVGAELPHKEGPQLPLQRSGGGSWDSASEEGKAVRLGKAEIQELPVAVSGNRDSLGSSAFIESKILKGPNSVHSLLFLFPHAQGRMMRL